MNIQKKGFTLIELLVVIAVIAILSTVVFVALNPVKRFADSRNVRRFTDVNTILTAIHQYTIDNGGTPPSPITVPQAQTELGTCVGCDNAATSLAPYLKSIPMDPSVGVGASGTGYWVTVDANGIVTVGATYAESGLSVQVSR